MAKINVAFLLGLYDREILAGLITVRKIRNKFAHHAKPIRFCDEIVADLCRALGTNTARDPNDLQERYLAYLYEVRTDIQLNLSIMSGC